MPLYTLVGFLGMFGLLVAVHEWGHYYAARRLGIEATHFSIGFGPVIWSRVDRRGTVWQVCLFLVGGYVRFLGDKDGSSASADPALRAQAATLTPEERSKRYHLRGPGARAIVIAAGPLTNLVLGLALLTGLYVAVGRPSVPPVIDRVIAGEPAAAAGVKPGDRVVTINGHAARSWVDVHDEIALYPGALVHLDIERNEGDAKRRLDIDVQSVVGTVEAFGSKQTVGRIGIVSGPATIERLNPVDALSGGLQDIWKFARSTYVAIGQIVSGSRPFDEVGGPIRMAESSGQALKAGFAIYVFYVAAISVSLGLMNLMPIPVLDGGALVVCAIEAVMRRPVDNRVLGYAHKVGGFALVALMAVVSFGDLRSLIHRLML